MQQRNYKLQSPEADHNGAAEEEKMLEISSIDQDIKKQSNIYLTMLVETPAMKKYCSSVIDLQSILTYLRDKDKTGLRDFIKSKVGTHGIKSITNYLTELYGDDHDFSSVLGQMMTVRPPSHSSTLTDYLRIEGDENQDFSRFKGKILSFQTSEVAAYGEVLAVDDRFDPDTLFNTITFNLEDNSSVEVRVKRQEIHDINVMHKTRHHGIRACLERTVVSVDNSLLVEVISSLEGTIEKGQYRLSRMDLSKITAETREFYDMGKRLKNAFDGFFYAKLSKNMSVFKLSRQDDSVSISQGYYLHVEHPNNSSHSIKDMRILRYINDQIDSYSFVDHPEQTFNLVLGGHALPPKKYNTLYVYKSKYGTLGYSVIGTDKKPHYGIIELTDLEKISGEQARELFLIIEKSYLDIKQLEPYLPLLLSAIAEKGDIVYRRKVEISELVLDIINCVSIPVHTRIEIKEPFANDDRIKLKRLERIEHLKTDLVALLQKESKEDSYVIYLDEVLEDLIKKNFQGEIDSHLIEKMKSCISSFKGKFEEISNICVVIGNEIDVNQIMIDIVLHANYGRLVKKAQSLSVLKTMELLKSAFDHIQLMTDQDLIMVLGKTGAGKSTSVNKLAGIPLKEEPGRYGVDVIDVDLEELSGRHPDAVTEYAKIGQSLVTSETAYVHAYKIIKQVDGIEKLNKLRLCDTPGFRDTRGVDYDLSTTLSIEQAIRRANSIKSVVLVVPYDNFSGERANSLVELLVDFESRLPGLFEEEVQKNNQLNHISQSVFLLITKHSAYPRAEATFRDRLQQQVVEEQQQLISKKGSDEYGQNVMVKRVKIWRMLLALLDADHIHFMDIDNQIQRKNLLKKYALSPGIDKEKFADPLDTRDTKDRFSKYIEMSTHTWQELIIEPYLYGIPRLINSINFGVEQQEAQCISIEEDIYTKETIAIPEAEANVAAWLNRIDILNNLKLNPEADITDEILIKDIEDAKHAGLKKMKDTLASHQADSANIKSAIENTDREIKAFEEDIEKINEEIARLNDQVQELQEGSEDDILWEYKRDPDQMLNINTLKDGAYEKAFNEVRSTKAEDYESTKKIPARQYCGELVHIAEITREYCIVPKDKQQRELFMTQGYGTFEAGRGQYTAHLNGVQYALYRGKDSSLPFARKSDLSGKRMVYSFKTTWKADGVIPSISITHTIPNMARNEATIINKLAEKALKEQRKAEKSAKLKDQRENLEKLKNTLEEKQSQIKALELAIEQEEKSIMSRQNESLLKKCQSHIEHERRVISSTKTEIEKQKKKLFDIKARMVQDKQRIQVEQQRKKYFSVIVKKQHSIARLLKEFSELAVSGRDNLNLGAAKDRGALRTQCLHYIEYYNNHEQQLLEECERDLQIEYLNEEKQSAAYDEQRENYFIHAMVDQLKRLNVNVKGEACTPEMLQALILSVNNGSLDLSQLNEGYVSEEIVQGLCNFLGITCHIINSHSHQEISIYPLDNASSNRRAIHLQYNGMRYNSSQIPAVLSVNAAAASNQSGEEKFGCNLPSEERSNNNPSKALKLEELQTKLSELIEEREGIQAVIGKRKDQSRRSKLDNNLAELSTEIADIEKQIQTLNSTPALSTHVRRRASINFSLFSTTEEQQNNRFSSNSSNVSSADVPKNRNNLEK